MRERVLIVENDQALRESLDVLLTFEGYETYCCAQKCDLINFIHNFDPQVILLDITQAEGIQQDMSEQLRIYSSQNYIAVILLVDDPQKIKLSEDFIPDDILIKPFEEDSLINAIERQLSVARMFGNSIEKPLN